MSCSIVHNVTKGDNVSMIGNSFPILSFLYHILDNQISIQPVLEDLTPPDTKSESIDSHGWANNIPTYV